MHVSWTCHDRPRKPGLNIRRLVCFADDLCSRHKHVVLVAVLGLSTVYLAKYAYRDWVPSDEGTIALSAERVLNGEVPHRDYDQGGYTGGLTYLHALGFKLLGIRLTSLRLVLLVFGLAFASSLYFVALRAAPPLFAALASMLCVAWSLPNYFASLPSWYNLFFAAFGTLALL